MRVHVRVYEDVPSEGWNIAFSLVFICVGADRSTLRSSEWKMLGVPPRRLSRHLSPPWWLTPLMSRTRPQLQGAGGRAREESGAATTIRDRKSKGGLIRAWRIRGFRGEETSWKQ